MQTIKYFDEITVINIITELNKISPIESIVLEEEYMDNVKIQRKKYRVKFKNEEEYCFVHITDIPFRIKNGIAEYPILFQTSYGRIYVHENDKMNMIELETKFSSLKKFVEAYEKRENKTL